MRTKVRFDAPYSEDNIHVAVIVQHDDGSRSLAEPLTLKAICEGDYISQPTMRLTRDEAQLMMDGLWDVGIRPTEGKGSAGAMAATERHLKDLQRIIFEPTP